MFHCYQLRERLRWPLIRAHLCTIAVSVSLNATWRVPRDGFRYGGLGYGVLLTVALVTVALPVTLLQLALGQLSQQDAVGVWRAVPFFRGIGHIRLLVSFLGAAYTTIYVALTIAYFLYSASHNIPFIDCTEWIVVDEEELVNGMNASECLSNTFMSPVSEGPEYYLAIALILVALWIVSPFVFYNPVKLMKRLMYILAPLVVVLGIVILSCIGYSSYLSSFEDRSHWQTFKEPRVWIDAIVQALWSNQIAGGYLISAGDSVYSSTNIQWTALFITSTNIIASWFWLIFWFGISGTGIKDTSNAAVLVQMYQVAEEQSLDIAWPLLVYLTLMLSGVISILVLLYPVYDRLRRIGGPKWRLASFASALAGAGISLAMLAGGLRVISVVEYTAVSLLICLATVFETLAFGSIYGWRTLIEDVEFLIGSELIKYWVWGWWLSPAIIIPFAIWWLTTVFIDDTSWIDPPWEAVTVLTTAVLACIVFLLCGVIAVARQVQYDIFGKLKSSFVPSRHWGPRDPITHYYWLARREEFDRNMPRTRYNRRELGQLSRSPSFFTVSDVPSKDIPLTPEVKNRSNSDDWLYTSGRKKHLTELHYATERKRSKSLDWDVPISKYFEFSHLSAKSVLTMKGDNNNILRFKYNDVELK